MPTNKKRYLACALTLTSLAGPTFAASQEDLGTIQVEATPMSVGEILDAPTVPSETLRTLSPATSDTTSLLRNIPGLSSQGAGGVSSLPSLRGLADDRLRVKVDGMDLISACANHMNPPLSYIDPSSVGSATVFAGTAPVSSGGDSIGGTILVSSHDLEFAQTGQGLLRKGEIGAFFRSNGNARGGNLGGTIANENVSFSYKGSTAEADNYKAGADFKPAGLAAAGRGWLDGDEVGSSMYNATNHLFTLGMRQDNHLVDLKLGFQEIPYQGWPNQRMDMTDNSSTQANLHYNGRFAWGDLDTRLYHERTRHEMQFGDDKLFWYGANNGSIPDGEPGPLVSGMNGRAAGMPMDTEGINSGLVIKGEIPLSKRDLLRIGGEVQQYNLDDWWDPSGKGMWPNTFWNINHGERDRLALFGEWEAQWNPQWLTQLGVRGEQVDMNTGTVQGYSATTTYNADVAAFNAADREKTDHNLDLTVLTRFTPDDTRTFELGYARKTRSPNLHERYSWSTGGMVMRMVNMAGDGNGYVGNLGLDPEVANTFSATFDLHDESGEKWGFKVTPYYTYIDDYIDAERLDKAEYPNTPAANLTTTDAFVYLRFVNQSARLYGVDVSGFFPLAQKTQWGDFSASGILSYVRGENRTTDDNLYNIMPLNVKLAMHHRTGSWSNSIEVELVDDKSKTSQVRNELKTSSYGLVHLRGSYQWQQVRLDFGVENLFDKFYNHPLGGAYTGQGKTMSETGIPWGTPVPGMGRSLYAGVNIKF